MLVHNIITEDTPKAERHKVEVAENGPKLKKYHKLMGLFKPGGKISALLKVLEKNVV